MLGQCLMGVPVWWLSCAWCVFSAWCVVIVVFCFKEVRRPRWECFSVNLDGTHFEFGVDLILQFEMACSRIWADVFDPASGLLNGIKSSMPGFVDSCGYSGIWIGSVWITGPRRSGYNGFQLAQRIQVVCARKCRGEATGMAFGKGQIQRPLL